MAPGRLRGGGAEDSGAVWLQTHPGGAGSQGLLSVAGSRIPAFTGPGCGKIHLVRSRFGAVIDNEIDFAVVEATVRDTQRRLGFGHFHIRFQQAVEHKREQAFQTERKVDAGTTCSIHAGLQLTNGCRVSPIFAKDFLRQRLDAGGWKFTLAVSRQSTERNYSPALTYEPCEILPCRQRQGVHARQDDHPSAEPAVHQRGRFRGRFSERAAVNESKVPMRGKEALSGSPIEIFNPRRSGGLSGPVA